MASARELFQITVASSVRSLDQFPYNREMARSDDIDGEVERLVGLCIAVGRRCRRPVVEALWDGDTQGWFLDLFVSTERERCHVAMLSYGSDLRLFNGTVPAWPEAEVAGRVARRLRAVGFTIWFPSPEHPDDECPAYSERETATACVDCGKLILPRSQPYIPAEFCHRCYRIREGQRVAKERAAALLCDPPPLASPRRELVMLMRADGEETGRMIFSSRSDQFGVLVELLTEVAPCSADLDDDQFLDATVLEQLQERTTELIRDELERLGPVEPAERYRANEHEFEGETIHLFRIGSEHQRVKALLSLAKKFEATSISLFSNRGLRRRETHLLHQLRQGRWNRDELEQQMLAVFGSRAAVLATIENLYREGCIRDLESLELTEKGRFVGGAEDPL